MTDAVLKCTYSLIILFFLYKPTCYTNLQVTTGYLCLICRSCYKVLLKQLLTKVMHI